MSKELTPEQRAKRAAQKKQYRQNNKVEIAAHDKRYYQNNKVKIDARMKQYDQDHKVEIAARKKQYQQDNRTEVAAYNKQYDQDHKPERNTRDSNRRANDIDYKLKVNFGREIKRSIKGNKQCRRSTDLLDLTISGVREHLERQFQPGMTWDNWSLHGWHIDHIIPLASFDFTDYEQQKQAWRYTNLRPLWAEENLRKSNKIIERQLILI